MSWVLNTVKIFSDLIRKTKQFFRQKYYWKQLNITRNLWEYNDIKLKLYLEIATTGNYKLLIKNGSSTIEILTTQWEQIVKMNSVENGSFDYLEYFELVKTYNLLISEYNVVKAMLCKLQFMVDTFTIDYLRERNYKINTDGKRAYALSIYAASKKADGLQTKIQRKQNEIMLLHTGNKGGQKVTFEKIIARLSAGSSFSVSRELTLAEY